jgi:CRISPR-associated endoribonuclease Cas6
MTELPDLTAIVVRLRSQQAHHIKGVLGSALLQAVLRQWLEPVDATLARDHHDSNTIKPYTISGLFKPDSTQLLHGDIAAGDEGWLRVSALCAQASAALGHPPPTLNIDGHEWEVIAVDRHGEWAGTTWYAKLAAEQLEIPTQNRFRLAFATRTTFHRAGIGVPLPEPTLVFGSLQMRWLAFSGYALPSAFYDFLTYKTALTHHCIEAAPIQIKTGVQVGFRGEATFSAVGRMAHLKQLDLTLRRMLEQQHEICLHALMLLTEFAFYSGVGAKTTMGMGMCRCF